MLLLLKDQLDRDTYAETLPRWKCFCKVMNGVRYRLFGRLWTL